jgi:hypothetical protein
MVAVHPYPPAELEDALRKVAQRAPLTQDEREMVLQALDETPAAAGGIVLTDEEADELERDCLAADEDRKTGRFVSHAEILTVLGGA